MNLGEIILVLFIMFVLALTSSLTSQSRDEAELARDVAVVRDVALRYVNFKCSNLPSTLPPTLPPILPPTAVTLTRAATELGMTVRVQHPDRWRVLLTPRPGWTGTATALQYLIGANTWQWVYLLDTWPAVAQTGQVHLHIYRKPGSPNRRGFQSLLEGTLC